MSLRLSLLTLLVALGCTSNDPRMPARTGVQLEITRAPVHVVSDPTALQIRWLGTTCYVLELGELSVLLDPFVSNGYVYPWNMESRKDEVLRRFAPLTPAPQAVFVTETHTDHFLDAHAALRLWPEVTLYGSRTAQNLLAGYGLRERARDVAEHPTGELNEPREEPRFALTFEAFASKHTPHFKSGWTFLGGGEAEPLEDEPGFWDYQAGEAYNYLFTFRSLENPALQPLRVFMLNAPHSRSFPLPPADTPIDVLLILTPSTETVEGDYPAEWIHRLQPRIVVLAHFDDFLSARDYDQDPPTKVLYEADVLGFLLEAQRAALSYPRFERIVVPALSDPSHRAANTVVRVPLRASD